VSIVFLDAPSASRITVAWRVQYVNKLVLTYICQSEIMVFITIYHVGKGSVMPNEECSRHGCVDVGRPEENAATVVPRHHLFIAGTGRAGTSFLVRYLAELGLETHIARHGSGDWSERASAGFEDLPMPAGNDQLPYVVKSPWLTECIDSVLADPAIRIDAVVIPVRSLAEAATSRTVLERQATHANIPLMTRLERPWQNSGITPGGVVFSLDPVDQARLLAVGFHILVEQLVQHDIPIILLDFPRFIQDWRYLFKYLHPHLPIHFEEEAAQRAHARIANQSLVRTGSEIAAERGPRPISNTTIAPSDSIVDNIALRRELSSVRAELAGVKRGALETEQVLSSVSAELAGVKRGALETEQVLSSVSAELAGVKRGALETEQVLSSVSAELAGVKRGALETEQVLSSALAKLGTECNAQTEEPVAQSPSGTS